MKLTHDQFISEVIESKVPVLVDFWAEWCPPCRIMLPIIEELEKKYEGKAKIFKVNVDEESRLSDQFNIQSIPSFLYFTEGYLADQLLGAVPKEILEEKLTKLIK